MVEICLLLELHRPLYSQVVIEIRLPLQQAMSRCPVDRLSTLPKEREMPARHGYAKVFDVFLWKMAFR